MSSRIAKQQGKPGPAPTSMARPATHGPDPGAAQRVIDALPAMVGYWDAELRNVLANRAYLDFFGVRPDRGERLTMRELLGPELYERNRPYIEGALDGKPQLFNRTITDPSGQQRYTQASYIPDIVDGEVRGFAVLVTDITARRIAEEARARAEARFQLAFSHSPVGMGLIDEDRRLLDTNDTLCTMLGYEEAELRGLSVTELVIPAHRAREIALDEHLMSTGEPTSGELQLMRKGGAPVWVLVSLSLAETEEDEAFGIAHVQDISARKQAEEELELSRARLNEAEQVAEMGSWEWDIRQDRITWSDGLFRLFGLSPDSFDPHFDKSYERVFPEDRELVSKTIERTLAEHTPFTMEYRALRADGRVRTMRSRGEVIVDEEGEATRLIGIAHDITDAKLAREALRSTSAQMGQRELELQTLALRDAQERRPEPRSPLTPRQLEILRLVARGKTSPEIAEELMIAEGTVKWHVKQILAKTASSSRAEAVARVLGSDT